MPRQKKNNHPLSVRMDLEIYERLERFSEESGIPKTTVIEKGVAQFINDFEKKMNSSVASDDKIVQL